MDKTIHNCLACKYGKKVKGRIVCTEPHILKAAREIGIKGDFVYKEDIPLGYCPDFTPAS